MTGMATLTGMTPVVAESGAPLRLAMQSLWLTGRLMPVGARLWVRHEFRSQEERPVEVVYCFMLPRDAALRRFRIQGDGFSVDSALKRREEATREYEEAIETGSLAGLVRQYGDGVVNLSAGNVRPGETVSVLLEMVAGVELHDEGFRFRFPFTLAPSYHPRARSIESAPGWGELELPESDFGDVMLPRFAKSADGLHQVGFALSAAMAGEITEVSSPSHSIRVHRNGPPEARISLAPEADLPDRDLVLDIKAAFSGVLAGSGRDGKGHFAAIIPSSEFGRASSEGRRVAIVLDRSGSMGGVAIQQAKRAIEACLGALSPSDWFGLVAFDNVTESFRPKLVEGTKENRQAASQFLESIEARGGTELAAGVNAAAALLGGEPGDLLILTDGQVFGTEAILEQARATRVRLHCLGIGSASQDRFLSLLAGQTGGVCRFLTPRERVDIPAVELFAALGRPVASEITASVEGGQILVAPAANVYAGTPMLAMGNLSNSGEGLLAINCRGAEGPARREIAFRAQEGPLGDVLLLLEGARRITDLESRYPSGTGDKREASRIADWLVRLSEEYGLASREMSLVAVVRRAGDSPGRVPKTMIVPVGIPADTGFASVFSRARATMRFNLSADMPNASILKDVCHMKIAADAAPGFSALFLGHSTAPAAETPPLDAAEEVLLDLAARLESDGGMPGKDSSERILNTLTALLAFASNGSTRGAGPFRMHVQRLIAFLESQELPPAASEAIGRIERGKVHPDIWKRHARRLLSHGSVDAGAFWKDLRAGR